MRLVIILFLLFADPGSNIHKVARANKAKSTAEKAYKTGNYQEALKNYQYLTDSLKVADEEVMLDKAHCYYKLKDKDNAQKSYSRLASATDKSIGSIANQQLGLLAYEQKDLGKALNYFKAALKAYPNNQEARYNYELVKKLMKDQEKNDQKQNKNKQDQNKDQKQDQKQNEKDQQNQQDKKDQQDQQNKEDQQKKDQDKSKDSQSKDKGDKKDQDKSGQSDEKKKEDEAKEKQAKEEKAKEDKDKKGDKKEQDKAKEKDEKGEKGEQGDKEAQDEKEAERIKKENISKKLKELNLNEEKARMILEAMRSNEVQYLQQVKKRPKYIPDRNKPDW